MTEFKEIKDAIHANKIIVYLLCFIICSLSYHVYKNSNRLNEQKRLLIAQQQQINQLILNAKQNELNK